MSNDLPHTAADSDDSEPDDGKPVDLPPPGPADHGGRGGMATRENAPELAEGDEPRD